MPINKVQSFEFDTINNAPWTGRSSIGELLYSILNLTEGQTASPIGSGAEMSLPMMSTPLLMGMSKRYTPGMKYRREFYRNVKGPNEFRKIPMRTFEELVSEVNPEQLKNETKVFRKLGKIELEPSKVQSFKLNQFFKGNPKYKDFVKPTKFINKNYNHMLLGTLSDELNMMETFLKIKPGTIKDPDDILHLTLNAPGGPEFIKTLPTMSKQITEWKSPFQRPVSSSQGPQSKGAETVMANRSIVERMIKSGQFPPKKSEFKSGQYKGPRTSKTIPENITPSIDLTSAYNYLITHRTQSPELLRSYISEFNAGRVSNENLIEFVRMNGWRPER